MNFNPLPEEQQRPELIRSLQEMYQELPEDRASLARIQARLFQVAPTQLQELSASQQALQAGEPAQHQNGNIVAGSFGQPRSKKPWPHRLGLIAAVLVVLLLTGATVSTFLLLKGRSRPAISSRPTPVPSGPQRLLGHGISLDEKGLFMATSQVGWTVPEKYAAHGPVFRTTDGGKSWKQVKLPQGLSGPYFHFSVFDENMAFLLPSDAPAGFPRLYFYRTMDGGETWQRCNWPTTPETTRDGVGTFDWTFLDHTHGWVNVMRGQTGTQSRMPPLTGDDTLFRTDDGGLTWQQVARLSLKYMGSDLTFTNAQTGWITTAIDDPRHPDPSDPNSFPAALYVTHDGGHSWKQQPLPTPLHGPTLLVSLEGLTFFTESKGYLFGHFSITNTSEAVYLYMTQDGGNSWQISGKAFPTFGLNVVDDTHSSNGIFLYTLINGEWVKTSNAPGGDTVSNESLSSQVDVAFLSSQVGVALVKNTDVYRTSDGGKSWQKVGVLPNGT